MTYRPPQKRATKAVIPKDEFPALAPAPAMKETSMNFASLFKNALKKKKRIKKLKWGTVLLTKNGMIDSLTPEERLEEEENKNKELQ
jgi:hypothetical protein